MQKGSPIPEPANIGELQLVPILKLLASGGGEDAWAAPILPRLDNNLTLDGVDLLPKPPILTS